MTVPQGALHFRIGGCESTVESNRELFTRSLDDVHELYCVGSNPQYMLLIPGGFLPLTNVRGDVQSVTMGSKFTCVIDRDATLRCAGQNDRGQLGRGTISGRDDPNVLQEQPIGISATRVSLGAHHACARLVDGGIACWGSNDFGELGIGDAGPDACQSTPQVVILP